MWKIYSEQAEIQIFLRLALWVTEATQYNEPPCAQTMDVDSLGRWVVDVFFGESGDQVLANDAVQGPAFVTPSHLLAHGREEALRVEEPRDPEYLYGWQKGL